MSIDYSKLDNTDASAGSSELQFAQSSAQSLKRIADELQKLNSNFSNLEHHMIHITAALQVRK